MPKAAAEELTRFAIAVYEAAGTPSPHAEIVARHQVGANLAVGQRDAGHAIVVADHAGGFGAHQQME